MEQASLRRPRHAAYACGDETRERILEAAIRLFGERGFEAASTREIARRAGVNAPVLNYHFESKEGLYRACAASIAEGFRAHFEPLCARMRSCLDGACSADALLAGFDDYLDSTTEFLLTRPDGAQRRLFMAQEQAGNGPGGGFDQQIQDVRERHWGLFMELVARLTGRSVEDPVLRLRAISLHGQLTTFHVFQRPVLAMLGWDRLDAGRIAQIRQLLREQAHVLIDAWRRDAPG